VSRFDTGVSTEVGSWPPMYGEAQIGGKISGGGLGCGAQPTRFSPPSRMLPNWPACVGPSVFAPVVAGAMRFLPSDAHSVPPPDWQPNGAGPLLNVPSRPWPIIMSPTAVSSGARMSRLLSELSRVSVYTPDDPPLIVHWPGISAGRSVAPWKRTFWLFGKLVRSSASEPNVWYVGSNVGMPVDWPKPFRSMTERPGIAPERPT
jgi:hypothetical protein